MKMEIGDFIVDVTAKKKGKGRNNKSDTEFILLEMEIAFWYASDYCQRKGLMATKDVYADYARTLHKSMKNNFQNRV